MYQIRDARLYLRAIGAAAVEFKIGKQTKLFPDWMPGIVELEVEIGNIQSEERAVLGIAGDWPAFGWLDKRHAIPERLRLSGLLNRLSEIRDRIVGLQFNDVEDAWSKLHCDELVPLKNDGAKDECHWGPPHTVQLCETFCLAMFERAILDGMCRWHGQPFRDWIKEQARHSTQQDFSTDSIPMQSVDYISVRHTIGLGDPIRRDSKGNTPTVDNSLETVLDRDGVEYFKIKVSGQVVHDVARLRDIWELIRHVRPKITIDGNESFSDAALLLEFVETLEREIPEMFECVRFIEQPLERDATFRLGHSDLIRTVASRKPLVIDEADTTVDSFRQAVDLGYTGVSHKNCKGIVKSFRNLDWIHSHPEVNGFLTGEDLTNVPLAPLHQDLTVASVLGLEDVERNGHHYFPGLLHFPDSFVQEMLQDYSRLYEPWESRGRRSARLRIVDGKIDVRDLHGYPGLGVKTPPPNEKRIELNCYRVGQ